METATPTLHALSRNIKDAKEIADALDFPIILDCGSLLGAYRDGGPIKNDMDDVDFAVPYEVMQFKALQTIRAFEARGFELHRLRDTVMTFKRDGVKVDFLFYQKQKDHMSLYRNGGYFFTLYHNKQPHALLTNGEAYDELGEIEYCGTKLQCPADIEAHLEYRYGDWRTPILRPAFSFQNYIDKGVMIPLL